MRIRLTSACLFLSCILVAASSLRGEGQTGPPPCRVGLVLSGGGARGAAHIGALKVLEKESIPIDCIAGTSFGALVGGLYSLGYSAADLERIFNEQDWDSVFSNISESELALPITLKKAKYQGELSFEGYIPELPSGLLYGQKLTEVLDSLTTERMIVADYDFDRLPIPFRAVATNLVDGTKYVFSQGPMTEALRASTAIPLLFSPVEKGQMLLVDGGLVDNLPTDVVRSLGAKIVIAIDTASPLLTRSQIRTLLDVADQSVGLLMQQHVEENLKLADMVIKPDLEKFSYTDYGHVNEIAARGAQAVEENIRTLKSLVAGVPPRRLIQPVIAAVPVIESVSLEGLKEVPARQLQNEIRVRTGEAMDLNVVLGDIRRLYATGLFDHVGYRLLRTAGSRYQLIYRFKEASLNTLGASIRYDRDYKFVALAEVTARQLFHTPSILTLSAQFGGIDDDYAGLRYIPSRLPFLFIAPKGYYRRQPYEDVRDQEQVGVFTLKKLGGQMMIGGSFGRFEIEAGYQAERATVEGGVPPLEQESALRLAGLRLQLYHNTLDRQRFPSSGTVFRIQGDKLSEPLGSDVSYSKWYGELLRFFPLTEKSTLRITGTAGYSRGEVPFYERFYIGGFSFSDIGPIQLLGYRFDELACRQLGLFSGAYRYQLFSRPFGFAKSGYLTGYYNLAAISNQTQTPYHFKAYHGVGAGFSLETMIGPLRFATGWGEGGRLQFYLSLGPRF